ncbi:hypothetical protein TWF173_011156 [Orbilia oligospora]|nr:hypothetical protein TWF173_011156 [Orbilia oligospora]
MLYCVSKYGPQIASRLAHMHPSASHPHVPNRYVTYQNAKRNLRALASKKKQARLKVINHAAAEKCSEEPIKEITYRPSFGIGVSGLALWLRTATIPPCFSAAGFASTSRRIRAGKILVILQH